MKKRFKLNYHLLLLAVIALVFLTALFILLRWNRGVPSGYDPSETSDEFDVEALDYFFPFDPAFLEGREDDGELHILCLGNNPFSDDRGAQGLAALIAKETGGTTYDCAFPDSMIANRPVAEEIPEFFSLFFVTMALVNHDFSFLQEAAEQTEDQRYRQTLEVLRSVDMEKIDLLLIMYDSTDYNQRSPEINPNHEGDINTFAGGLSTSIGYLQQFFPHVRIILMSLTYAQYLDEKGELHSGTNTDLGYGTLPVYLNQQYFSAYERSISFIDNYFGTINEDNFRDYMVDHMHYNEAGRELLAKRAAEVILR
jgi:hypothetical protein